MASGRATMSCTKASRAARRRSRNCCDVAPVDLVRMLLDGNLASSSLGHAFLICRARHLRRSAAHSRRRAAHRLHGIGIDRCGRALVMSVWKLL